MAFLVAVSGGLHSFGVPLVERYHALHASAFLRCN